MLRKKLTSKISESRIRSRKELILNRTENPDFELPSRLCTWVEEQHSNIKALFVMGEGELAMMINDQENERA